MKKILNKKWTWLLVLPAIIAISSCKKNFLDRKPLGRYTEEDIAAGSFEVVDLTTMNTSVFKATGQMNLKKAVLFRMALQQA